VKRKPPAIALLLFSLFIWCIPLFALIMAAIGDCFGPNCPTEAERAFPMIVAAIIALVLQIAAAAWYARAHYGD
jgi:hypothetical protein